VVPQVPQLAALVIVSTHAVPHNVCPAGQVQALLTQSCPAAHGAPQPPQLSGSLVRSTQLWSQAVCPAGQVSPHTPAEQSCPPGHAVPQAPQLAPSLCRSTHAPAQENRPVRHAHWPPTQLWSAAQAALQAPQWAAFELRSTHSVLHWVRPAEQAGTAVVPPALSVTPPAPRPPELASAPPVLSDETAPTPSVFEPDSLPQASSKDERQASGKRTFMIETYRCGLFPAMRPLIGIGRQPSKHKAPGASRASGVSSPLQQESDDATVFGAAFGGEVSGALPVL
jgi:hypothetical protein